MGKPLTTTDFDLLQSFVVMGDRIGYYTQLSNWGYRYATLALGVVNNDTLPGASANLYFLMNASSNGDFNRGELAQVGLDLMQADFNARLNFAGTSQGEDLPYDQIQLYHNSVFAAHGVSADAWTPNIALNSVGTVAEKSAMWETFLTSSAAAYQTIVSVSAAHPATPPYQEYLDKVTLAGSQALLAHSNDFGTYDVSWNSSRVIGGGPSDDALIGSDGSDVLMGFDGKDVLRGAKGDDHLYGGGQSDILSGGSGKDLLDGGDSDDILVGGDTSISNINENIDFTADHTEWEDHTGDVLSGGYGNDTYLISATVGDTWDWAYLSVEDASVIALLDVIDTIDETDADGVGSIRVQLHEPFEVPSQQFREVDANGSFQFSHTDQYGTNVYVGAQGGPQFALRNMTIDGETVPYLFMLAGYPSSPVVAIKDFRQGDFGITLQGYDRTRTSSAGTTNNQLFTAGIQTEQFSGGAGNDGVDYSFSSGSVTVNLTTGIGSGGFADGDSFASIENAVGSAFADVLIGNTGDNILIGGAGDDIIRGGGGNDVLQGDAGNDLFYAASGLQVVDGGDGSDTLTLAGTRSDFTVTRLSATLTKIEDLNGLSVIASNIEFVQFLNGDGSLGQTVSFDQLLNPSTPATILGTSGDDHLTGTAGDDVFDSLGGNDYVNGGEGSDTYLYSVNDGDEYIDDEAGSMTDIDTLQLKDLDYSDVTFSYDRSTSSNLFMTVNSTGHVITLDEQYYSASEGWGLEKIEFADGISVGLQHSEEGTWSYKGTSGADHIVGAIWGKQDVFEGGGGNDYLSGEAGSDTYLYASGDGSDEIDDDVGFTDAGNVDVLKLTDLNASDISLEQSGDNLLVHILGTGDTITVDWQFVSAPQNFGIERIDFADGTSLDRADFITAPPAPSTTGTAGDDEITGTSGDDTIDGLGGNDLMWGEGGSDTYIYRQGDGSDQIAEDNTSTSDVDTLKLVDLNLSDLTFSRSSGDLAISVNGTSDTISIYWQYAGSDQYSGLEKILFANGMSADLYHGDVAWKLNGTEGNDQISSPDWGQSEIFNGGKGDDYLYGTAGSDTYLYASGDGSDEIDDDVGFTDAGNVDVLKLTDLNASDISLEQSGDNLLVHILGTGDTITVDWQFVSAPQNFGIERIDFADGTSMDRTAIGTASAGSSSSAMRMAVTSSAADSGPTTFALQSSDGADQATSEEGEVELQFWSTASDCYEDSETISALKLYDTNADNVLDVNDSRWDAFRVWSDSNTNGVVDDGELQSMTEAGIKLVNLLPAQGGDAFADVSATDRIATGPRYTVGDATFVASHLQQTANAA